MLPCCLGLGSRSSLLVLSIFHHFQSIWSQLYVPLLIDTVASLYGSLDVQFLQVLVGTVDLLLLSLCSVSHVEPPVPVERSPHFAFKVPLRASFRNNFLQVLGVDLADASSGIVVSRGQLLRFGLPLGRAEPLHPGDVVEVRLLRWRPIRRNELAWKLAACHSAMMRPCESLRPLPDGSRLLIGGDAPLRMAHPTGVLPRRKGERRQDLTSLTGATDLPKRRIPKLVAFDLLLRQQLSGTGQVLQLRPLKTSLALIRRFDDRVMPPLVRLHVRIVGQVI